MSVCDSWNAKRLSAAYSGVERNFWPIIVCQVFCFSQSKGIKFGIHFFDVLCNLKRFGQMSDTHKL